MRPALLALGLVLAGCALVIVKTNPTPAPEPAPRVQPPVCSDAGPLTH